jgi:hypothetical protein
MMLLYLIVFKTINSDYIIKYNCYISKCKSATFWERGLCDQIILIPLFALFLPYLYN